MNYLSLNIFLPLVLFLGISRNEDPVTEYEFDLVGRCSFTVLNNSGNAIKINLVNMYAIPLKAQEIDTTLVANSSLTFTLISQNNNYYNLSIDSVKYKIFSQPGSVDSLRIMEDTVAFSGALTPINDFLLKKAKKFNSIDADWLPRVSATGAFDNFEEVIKINDALTKVHINYVDENSELIPEWYRAFELKRQKYQNAWWKLTTLLYRKVVLNMKDSVSENFLSTTVDSLPVSEESMLGNTEYMKFLNDYILYKAYPQYNFENAKKESQSNDKYPFEAVNNELDGKVKDVYLTYYLGISIILKYAFDKSQIDYITDEQLRKILHSELASNPVLPQGTRLPYFYLSDSTNVSYEPSQFKGKILLINFWATSCKPCLKEFPHENDLVERFKGEPVLVINICIESEPDKWRSMIKKYDLKTINLIAEDNWSKKLSNDFDIQGLPHSVLVDWNGKVVQNKCPPASKSFEIISELLSKMKAEF